MCSIGCRSGIDKQIVGEGGGHEAWEHLDIVLLPRIQCAEKSFTEGGIYLREGLGLGWQIVGAYWRAVDVIAGRLLLIDSHHEF